MANEKRLIQQMAEKLIKAFPQGDRNNPCPFVYYETFTDIVWDIAAQMVDALEDAPTVDAVEVDALKAWLYEIAMNNSDNYLGDACEVLIGRLDGLREFARERKDEDG